MMLPAPNSTPNESSMMGSGVKNLENESENTAVTYMMMAMIEEMLNHKKIFFSVWIITSLLAGVLLASGSVNTQRTKLL